MKKILLIIFILVLSVLTLTAQDNKIYRNTDEEKNWYGAWSDWNMQFSFDPFFTFAHALKINLDIPLNSNGHYLILQPIFYYNDNTNFFSSHDRYDALRGYGLGTGHRIYLQKDRYLKSIYFQYNVLAYHFTTHYDQMHPITSTENGIEYIHFEAGSFSKSFTKSGLDIIMGKQFIFENIFVFDTFVGVGFRYTIDSNWKRFEEFNDYNAGIGYSGILLTGGLRIGILGK